MYRFPLQWLLLLAALIAAMGTYAQTRTDSLRYKLTAPCEGTDSAQLLNQLAQAYLRQSPDSMRVIGQRALAAAIRYAQPKELGRAYMTIGYADFIQSRLPQAQQFYLKALPLFTQHNDPAGLSEYHICMGNLAYQKSDWESAGNSYRKALKLAEDNGLTAQINRCQNNIGMIYLKTGYYEAAEAIFQSLLKAYEATKDHQGLATTYNNLGDARNLMDKDAGEVVGFYLKSVQLQRENLDKVGLANSYMTISRVYDAKNQPEKAIDYARLAFEMYDTLSMEERLVETGLHLSSYLQKHAKPDEALAYAEHARTHALHMNLYTWLLPCDLMLARYYLDRKDYVKADDCISEAGPLAATSRDANAQRTLSTLEAELRKHRTKK
jgi:tetratricopeptide (TPR) repeat protein